MTRPPSQSVIPAVDALVALGMTQCDIARELGVSKSMVSRWRAGEVCPTLDHACDLFDLAERVADDALARFEEDDPMADISAWARERRQFLRRKRACS